jgi:hypothetical protein
MSFLEQRSSGQYHLIFRFGGQRFKKALKTTQENVANAARVRLDENLRLVAAGRLVIPVGADSHVTLWMKYVANVGRASAAGVVSGACLVGHVF